MLRSRLFKPFVYLLNKKSKKLKSNDFNVKRIYGFSRFRCFWNFYNFKGYFKTFSEKKKKKESSVSIFYSKYRTFY